jgi:hypothetical protein
MAARYTLLDIGNELARQLLDDKSNIHDQGIANNTLIYFKMKKGSKTSSI